jgi:tetratricopeptide (TPR) repeat protein
VYDSILTDSKNELHEAVGQALEIMNRERLDDYYGLLSEHFIKSENYAKGAEYSRKAARKAEKSASMDNAIAYAEKMVSCVERLPQSDNFAKQRIDARTTLGLYLMQMNYHVEAKEAVDPIFDSAVKNDYTRRMGQIYQILGSYYCFVVEDQSEAIRILEEAMKLAAETQDLITYALGGFWLGYAYAYNCQFKKSFEYFQQVIDLNLASNNKWGAAAVKGNLALFCSWSWGKCDLGLKISGEAAHLAEQSGDAFSQGIAYAAHGYSCFVKGYLIEAEKYLLKSVDFCERIRFKSWIAAACICLGDLYWEKGNFNKSKENFEIGV